MVDLASACIPNSQNVVLIYDPKEKYFNTGGEAVTRNDGGPQVPNFYHALEPVKRGEIVAYEHNDAFTYVAADLTRAYSSVATLLQQQGDMRKTSIERLADVPA